ncbi:uncharacterized protein LOC6494478 [Drosophila ananassae]|nr:uncharacterized protein LOC6494478 [Drosophila ananassae]
MLNFPSTMSNLNTSHVLFALLIFSSSCVLASEECIFCRGINCQRSSYEAVEQCSDTLDACVSVFQEGTILSQGCLESVEEDYRTKCQESSKESGIDCEICVTDMCNRVGSKHAGCLQCNSDQDAQCAETPEALKAEQCSIARTGRSFCYAKVEDNRVERGCSLTLSDQVDCLADRNCHLCDPLEVPHCNNQLIQEDDSSTSTEKPTTTSSTSSPESSSPTDSPSSTTISSTDSPSSTTISTTDSPTNPPTTGPTNPPTNAPTNPPEIPTTTAKPNSAHKFHFSIGLIAAQLAFCLYIHHK